eukprot:CAMPEP_0117581500 /NCGR_PEP_ID=MMETSP0784-20121206/65864_1 /TAXON_ID=39447 /ORGANISM="" /LENGTH=136 /DNA_ID=CAMNT_0005381823 /DNA_START=47 /DNA_END=454 /DNA_ORIENTATION=+
MPMNWSVNSVSNFVSPEKSMSRLKTTWSTLDCTMGAFGHVRMQDCRWLTLPAGDANEGSKPNLAASGRRPRLGVPVDAHPTSPRREATLESKGLLTGAGSVLVKSGARATTFLPEAGVAAAVTCSLLAALLPEEEA